jgi:hypothetical protein
MSEASMWGRVRKALKIFDPIRIENRCELGTPDVNLVMGDWIELKWVRSAPKKGGILKLEHYSMEQKTWAIRRHNAGGKVWVLLKVSSCWMIFPGQEAPEYLGRVGLEELKKKATRVWEKRLNDQELRMLLSRSQHLS